MEVLEESIFPEKPPVVYASFWKRFVAVIIDVVLLLIFEIILIIPLAIIKHGILQDSVIANRIIDTIISWLYFALQESGKDMATLGKKAMNIEVTDLNGNRITFGQATGRYFGKCLSFLILGVGYFMLLWDEKNQTLHDKMAGTLVVQE